MTRLLLYITFIFTMVTSLAAAETIEHGPLRLDDARIRMAVPGANVTAAYVTITNTGSQAEYLLGAETEIARRVEIHRMEMSGDVMRMRPLGEPLEIKPGETVTLEAGGLHLMLMDLTQRKKKGETAPLSLVFEHAGKIRLNAPVVAMGHGH
ncbi:copper chaperone PCu(A)C [Alphaproteobacteria bacterium LSUCC0684]